MHTQFLHFCSVLRQRPIGTLSGGQKSRVSLAEICMRHPHILIFDEPTNHLDMESIHALVEALKDYKGTPPMAHAGLAPCPLPPAPCPAPLHALVGLWRC